MKLVSPYSADLPWYRGNLHTHTTNSDGRRDPQVVIDDYAARGYDFLMISDHDFLTAPAELDARGMVMIPGNEVTARGPHLLHVNAERVVKPHPDRQLVLDDIAQNDNSLAVLAHPNWHSTYNHYNQELLETLEGFAGIEIYNGVIERLPGSPLATDRWDRLLGGGTRVWGFANDDSHVDGDVELGWNVVQTSDRSAQGIVNALRDGAFYASTGVELTTVNAEATTIELRAAEEVSWVVMREWGRVIHREVGERLEWSLPDDFGGGHVRIEARGRLGQTAWMQPFFIDEDD